MIQLSNIGPPGRMRFARGSNPVIPRHQPRRNSAGSEPSACRQAQRRAAGMLRPSRPPLLELGLEIGKHFVALCNRQQPPKDAATIVGRDGRAVGCGAPILQCRKTSLLAGRL